MNQGFPGGRPGEARKVPRGRQPMDLLAKEILQTLATAFDIFIIYFEIPEETMGTIYTYMFMCVYSQQLQYIIPNN